MTNEQILRKAIEKALLNGMHKNRREGDTKYSGGARIDEYINDIWDKFDIFSHDFAKSFFGEEPNIDDFEQHELGTPAWQCALQEMALEEDRIQYLKQFL